MRPKLITKMIVRAFTPSAIVPLITGNVVCAPPAICISPLIILKR
jgi:hypothetical protein